MRVHVSGGELGDVGFCAELCDCEADCQAAGAVCDGFSDPALASAFGRAGVCAPAELAVGESLRCD